MTDQYEPHDIPDPMSRDGWIALMVIVLACVGTATVVVAATHVVAWGIGWVAWCRVG